MDARLGSSTGANDPQTGHIPRVLFFSTTSDKTESPYAALSEHTYGIRCLSFSPDSRFICSIGEVHDGFVFLWALHARTGMPKLHASNKCTSLIHDLAWMGSNSFITVGTRHVKLWRTDSLGPPSPAKAKFRSDLVDSVASSPSGARTLPGRNCLLGASLESTFTCVASISDNKAVICSDGGDVCLLDDATDSPVFVRAAKVDFSIKCVSVDLDQECIWIGGRSSEVRKFAISELEVFSRAQPAEDKSRSPSAAGALDHPKVSSTIVALGIVNRRLISVDAEHCINIFDIPVLGSGNSNETRVKKLQSHSSPVLGLNVSVAEDRKLTWLTTWDVTGRLIFWNSGGEFLGSALITLEQPSSEEEYETNELKVLRSSRSGAFHLTGDKHGTIRHAAYRPRHLKH